MAHILGGNFSIVDAQDCRSPATEPSKPEILPGLYNFRSIGPFAVSPGKHLKPNLLFRSASLDKISGLEITELQASHGIRAIFDLRDGKESCPRPMVASCIPVHQLSALTKIDKVDVASYFTLLESDHITAIADLYMIMASLSGPAARDILHHLRGNSGRPVLIHCELGKDRTGMMVAILLQLLGVSDADIIRDYHLSETGIRPIAAERAERLVRHPLLESRELSTRSLVRHFEAPTKAMALFLSKFRQVYGTAAAYLQAQGVDSETIERVRAGLVEDN